MMNLKKVRSRGRQREREKPGAWSWSEKECARGGHLYMIDGFPMLKVKGGVSAVLCWRLFLPISLRRPISSPTCQYHLHHHLPHQVIINHASHTHVSKKVQLQLSHKLSSLRDGVRSDLGSSISSPLRPIFCAHKIHVGQKLYLLSLECRYFAIVRAFLLA